MVVIEGYRLLAANGKSFGQLGDFPTVCPELKPN